MKMEFSSDSWDLSWDEHCNGEASVVWVPDSGAYESDAGLGTAAFLLNTLIVCWH